MRELLRDPDQMAQIVRRRVLRAMVPALGMLDRVARGRDQFTGDEQRHACVALARLATVVLGMREDPKAPNPFDAPEWQTPEKKLLFARLQWSSERTPEESQRFRAEVDARHAEYKATVPDFKTPEEICAYIRAHGEIKRYDDIEDECMPEHLRMSNLKKGDNHE
jgi:cytochrome c556